MNKDNYGKLITVEELKQSNTKLLTEEIKDFIESLGLPVGKSQMVSWMDCIEYLKNALKDTVEFDDVYLVFEYWLPLSSFRRPDVIMFFSDRILVLEFKRKNIALDVDKNQLRGYLNELINYHDITHNYGEGFVSGCLILTEGDDNIYNDYGLDVVSGNTLVKYLLENYYNLDSMNLDNIQDWIKSEYRPLLSILQSTYDIFCNNKIPQIKNIQNGELSLTQNYILNHIRDNNNEKKIFFLKGVPGSGKTLVLLNLLYILNNRDKCNLNMVYTSGNGPLISTLSYLLSKKKEFTSHPFIRNVKDIKSWLYDKKHNCAKELVNNFYKTIGFDEAQRVWDLKQMKNYGYNLSEAELFLQIQNKAYEKFSSSNLICSYGDGQSIYIGEEGGFEEWSNVLNKEEYKDWHIYCPEDLKNYFKTRDNITFANELSINTSIRADFININPLINAILDVNIEEAKEQVKEIIKRGFALKVVNNLDDLKEYLTEVKSQYKYISYGYVASSNSSVRAIKQKIPEFNKILAQTEVNMVGKWFIEDCKKLKCALSEFGCQGLELDLPIVLLGGDYIIKNGKWIINERLIEEAARNNLYKKILNYEDRDETIKNIYRVLLSRGRKGMILFIPDYNDFNEIDNFFKNIFSVE